MSKLEVSSNPSFTSSPFPLYKRNPGQDDTPSRKTLPIFPGTTIPDYARTFYNVRLVEPLTANFSFLNRDDKAKIYTPGDTDPFVFKNQNSINEFHQSAKRLLQILTKQWTDLGLSTRFDEDRKMTLPDTDAFSAAVAKNPKGSEATLRLSRAEEIASIVSNLEIMKKAALTRTVTPGWWIVSYAGMDSLKPASLARAARILGSWMGSQRFHPTFQKELQITLESMGDPLDTGVGFPLFSSNITASGEPLSKLKVLDQYKNTWTTRSWDEVRSNVSSRGKTDFERKHLFTVAPIRRIQPGYKWAHNWKYSSSGLVFSQDVRGHSNNRVAFMAPYLLNLMLSPIQAEWKTFRKLIPGMWHDGDARSAVLHGIKEAKSLVIESDFSNYDRTIPNDVISIFYQSYCSYLPDSQFYYGLLSQTHKNLPLAWADHMPESRNQGWLFTVPKLALLSGLKITAEIGSFQNLIINMAGWLDTGYKSEADILNLFNTAFRDPQGWKRRLQETPPELLILGDDTMLVASKPEQLVKLQTAFESGAKDAGIKSQIEMGDKFLMRHMARGADLPVAARVFQNTLSNEEPVEDPIKFLVGLAIRSDGFGGWKTFDPFQTGKNLGVTRSENAFSLAVAKELHHFVATAAKPITLAVQFLNLLASSLEHARPGSQDLMYIDAQSGAQLDAMRMKFLKMLAQSESAANPQVNSSSLLMQYHKNINSPASALALKSLLAADPTLGSILSLITTKENTFYRFAMKSLGIPATIKQK